MKKTLSKSSLINPLNVVYPFTHAQYQKLLCPICDGVAFQPVQCGKCISIYCRSHVSTNMSCVNCKQCKWKDTLNILKDIKFKLMDLKIKCECKSQLFRYTQFIQHFRKCEDEVRILGHSFRQFYFIEQEQEKSLSQDENATLNININFRSKQFQLNHYFYNLSKLQRSYYSQTKRKTIINKLEYRRSKFHNLRPYWTVSLQLNNYSLYDYENQHILEKAYQQYQRDKDKSKVNITVNNSDYLINFVGMIQIKIDGGFSRNINRSKI